MSFTPLLSKHTVLRAVIYIENALAYKSLYHRSDMLCLQMYRFMQTFLYRLLYGIVVGVLMMLAFVETPSSLSISSDFVLNNATKRYELPFGVTHTVEFFCILIFMLDFACRWWLSEMSITKSKWLIAYGTINIAHFILFWIYLGVRVSQFRVYRIFRPFYMIQHSSIMKKMLNAIKKSLPEVLGVLLVLFLNIVIFGLSGLIIFSDLKDDTYFGSISSSMWNLLVLITTANNPDVMIPTYRVNRLYVIFFVVFIWLATYGLMNLLLAVIYNQFRQHFKVSVKEMVTRRQVALRAAFEILTQSIQLKPSRSVSDSMRADLNGEGSDEDLIQIEPESNISQNSISLLEVSTLIGVIDLVRMRSDYKRYLFSQVEDNPKIQTDYLDKQDFVKLFLDIETDFSEWKKEDEDRVTGIELFRKIITNPLFELVGTILAITNTIALIVVMAEEPGKNGLRRGAEMVIMMNIVITIYYCVEQVLRMLGKGLRGYFSTMSYCWDFVLTIIIVILMITLYDNEIEKKDHGAITNILRFINLCICLRIVRVVLQVKRLKNVLLTYITLIRQMQVYLGILFALLYIFAIVGMELFSADVTTQLHNRSAVEGNVTLAESCGSYWNLDYYSLNFDDFFAAVVTLLTLMVVNNWHIIVQAFVFARGSWWVASYFIIWWVVCVLLVLNVIIALILDAFIDRWDNKTTTVSYFNFHVHHFVEKSERARPVAESELISALRKTKIIKNPFVNVEAHNVPSGSEVNSRHIFCKGPSV